MRCGGLTHSLLIYQLRSRLCWFDLDLSSTPFKTLKYHEKAVRSVAYHAKYPLMASASDDGTIHIFHAMVYSYVSSYRHCSRLFSRTA